VIKPLPYLQNKVKDKKLNQLLLIENNIQTENKKKEDKGIMLDGNVMEVIGRKEEDKMKVKEDSR
jgi:hypothetical protein